MPKRLNKYGLNINEAKSQMIKSGRDHAANLANKAGRSQVIIFLDLLAIVANQDLVQHGD
ncbi:putative reverse transcriptase [Orientia tsutsugamushi str. UT144]|uniref:Putative reverse transcriptase n=1 Tax=Orientia tsutsugamushi str. UT144 TaxID=1441384 RepID=A0A0F3RLG7_ORITS|nr:putative reverse transcriptase [Orientia tsutsugamushi str. UT144]